MPKTTKPKDPTKPRASKPREQLSLPLTSQLTKAVQLYAKTFRRSQVDVLADLLKLAAPGLAQNLEALRGTYEAAQREALAKVLDTGEQAGEEPAGDVDAPGLYGEHAP